MAEISVEKDGAFWRVVIDRPDRANALTGAMLACIADTAEAAVASGVRVLVLTGTGGVFRWAPLDEARAGLATDPVWERLSGAIAALPCLTIAALNGTLAGGAFGMVLACDLRLACRGAVLLPGDEAGLPAAAVGPRAVDGAGRAVAGQDDPDGWREGRCGGGVAPGVLVDRLVPAGGLDAAVKGLAADALAASDAHLAAIKAMIRLPTPW